MSPTVVVVVVGHHGSFFLLQNQIRQAIVRNSNITEISFISKKKEKEEMATTTTATPSASIKTYSYLRVQVSAAQMADILLREDPPLAFLLGGDLISIERQPEESLLDFYLQHDGDDDKAEETRHSSNSKLQVNLVDTSLTRYRCKTVTRLSPASEEEKEKEKDEEEEDENEKEGDEEDEKEDEKIRRVNVIEWTNATFVERSQSLDGGKRVSFPLATPAMSSGTSWLVERASARIGAHARLIHDVRYPRFQLGERASGENLVRLGAPQFHAEIRWALGDIHHHLEAEARALLELVERFDRLFQNRLLSESGFKNLKTTATTTSMPPTGKESRECNNIVSITTSGSAGAPVSLPFYHLFKTLAQSGVEGIKKKQSAVRRSMRNVEHAAVSRLVSLVAAAPIISSSSSSSTFPLSFLSVGLAQRLRRRWLHVKQELLQEEHALLDQVELETASIGDDAADLLHVMALFGSESVEEKERAIQQAALHILRDPRAVVCLRFALHLASLPAVQQAALTVLLLVCPESELVISAAQVLAPALRALSSKREKSEKSDDRLTRQLAEKALLGLSPHPNYF
jgi:hypothetical protein